MMETRETVRHFMTTNFYLPSPTLSDEASLLDQGIVDSTGVLEVVTFLETTFGVLIDDAELLPENLDSIARIVAFVERKQETTR
jgi:acyl carrier protein